MRFIPESVTVRYSSQYGKSTTALSGHWPVTNDSVTLSLLERRTDENPGYQFSLEPKESLFIDRVSLSGRIEGTLRPISVLKEGYQSWSFSGVMAPDQHQQKPRAAFVIANQEAVWSPPIGRPGHHSADTLVLLDDGMDESLLIAQHAPLTEYLSISINTAQQPVRITISWIIQREFSAGKTYQSSPVSVAAGLAEELLHEWSRLVSAAVNSSMPQESRPPTGWCSWYHYFNTITPEKLRANLSTAQRENLPFEIFQIDDGWQRRIGEWTETSPAFQDQMPALAAEISSAGFAPGLWLAPFIISRDAAPFHNPGWVLRNAKGKPVVAGYNPAWKGRYYALDLTHPEVIDYLEGIIRLLVDKWGYQYLKLDFLYAASLPGRRHDMQQNPLQVLRNALQMIRKAAGRDTRIMGCGIPLTAGIGLVDAARIGCDVAPRWGQSRRDRLLRSDSNIETRGAVRNTVLRSHLNKRFWHNDPDCLMLRKENTSLTGPERETWRQAVLSAGGSLFVSDDLSSYGESELTALRETFAEADDLRSAHTLPLRLFDDQNVYALYNDRGFVILFNLSDTERTIELRLARYRELLHPHTSYRPFEEAEDHPLEASRQVTVPPRGFKRISLGQ